MSAATTLLRPLSKAAGIVISGVVGVTLVEAVRSGRARRTAREGAVRATTWGIRAQRAAEVRAEEARLGWGDIVAEARSRTGEESPAPSATPGHTHEH